MKKRSSQAYRLHFSDEEMETPELKEPIRKAEKASVFPSEKELPDYTKTLAKREKIYQFIGVYTGGQQDENGRLLCEYWEVAIG